MTAPLSDDVADPAPRDAAGPVDVLNEDARWQTLRLDVLANRAATAALRHLGLDADDFEISCLGCNDARIAALNADFRGKPQPTNVLSWPSDERGASSPGRAPLRPVISPGETLELGDIAIAWETCHREAEAQGLAPEAHVVHLVVHAVLHLLGYDHDHDADATLMERLETDILATLGIADPYRPDDDETAP